MGKDVIIACDFSSAAETFATNAGIHFAID